MRLNSKHRVDVKEKKNRDFPVWLKGKEISFSRYHNVLPRVSCIRPGNWHFMWRISIRSLGANTARWKSNSHGIMSFTSAYEPSYFYQESSLSQASVSNQTNIESRIEWKGISRRPLLHSGRHFTTASGL